MKAVKTKRYILVVILLLVVVTSGCTQAEPTATSTPTISPSPTHTPTPTLSVSQEWRLEDILVAGSTVRVLLRVYAGIDVRVTLDNRDADEVVASLPVLQYVFENVAPGVHTVQVLDVVGYHETVGIVVATTTPTTQPEPTQTIEGFPAPTTRPVDPRVEISVDSETVAVGTVFTLTATAHDLGLPHYTLYVDSQPILTVTYEGKPTFEVSPPEMLEVVSYATSVDQITFVLRATEVGVATFNIGVTGEVHIDYPGPAYWGGAESDDLLVTFANYM